jgi:hypothetical protein
MERSMRTLCEHSRSPERGGAWSFSHFPKMRAGTPIGLPSSSAWPWGDYEGVVRVSRRVFQHLLAETPTPERCVEAYHLHRTRFELIAERKVRRRQLTDDGNVEINGRDLREREAAPTTNRIGFCRVAQ